MKRARDLAVFALLYGALTGCDESISKGWLVDRVRLLGARIEATADTTRATVAPGEQTRITWLAAGPAGAPRLAWSFAACTPPEGNFVAPKCEAPVLVSGSGTSNGGEHIAMDLVAPPAAAVGDAKELLFLAAFCEAGVPTLDARTFNATCPDGAPALLASLDWPLVASGENKNPEIGPDAILFDGTVLPITNAAPPGAPCTGAPDAPIVLTNAGERNFAFRFDGREREAMPPDGKLENLTLSHMITAGELDRQYSALDREEAAPKEVTIPWEPPGAGDVPDAGRLVEIQFVLRDSRGGTAFTRRTICARKP